MAVNPVRPTTKEPFAPGALYEIKVDTAGDAIADISFGVQFASIENGKQTATLRRLQGARAAGVCDEGDVIVEGAPVSVTRDALVTKAGEYRMFFGWRSDSSSSAGNDSRYHRPACDPPSTWSTSPLT